MPCYHPMTAWRHKDGRNESGKWPVTFNRDEGLVDMPVQIPCGRCIGCRLEYSRQWAVRLMEEAALHKENCFVTLTYDDSCLPSDGSLHVDDFQRFMKRLRKKNGRVRFFHCGEYGDLNGRPHYHAILFGYRPKDCKFYKNTAAGPLFTSDELSGLWRGGYCVIGDVTFQSAAYVARYVMKKQYGEKAPDHYQGRRPEYVTMSRRPGIAADWFKKYHSDVFPRDAVLQDGYLGKVPRYFDKLYESMSPDEFDEIRSERRREASHLNEFDQTPDRLDVREKIRKARISFLKRELDAAFD